jgi:hypothetical protein
MAQHVTVKMETEIEAVPIDTPVDEQPEVAKAWSAYRASIRECDPADKEFRRLARLASATTDAPDEAPSLFERLEAQAALLALRPQYLLLKAKSLGAEQRLNEVRTRTAERFTQVRRQSSYRRGLMQRLHSILEEAQPLVAEISAYDAESVEMGGRQGEVVWPELNPQLAENLVAFRRRRWESVGEM